MKLKNQSEIEQWQAFLEGDILAFDALMTTHFCVLFQYGSKFSNDLEFVKDCIQDLFLYLWENRTRLARPNSVKAYLMASLRRHIHRHKNSELLDPSISEENLLFQMEFSVEEAYIENESTNILSNHIKNILEALPKRQKEIVYLRFYQNLDRDQISEVLNISPQTVSNILQMAFKNIRKNWSNSYITFFILYFLLN